MITTLKQLQEWIDLPRETPNLEFKAAREQFGFDKLLRYCVALANEGGGKLILGVSDAPPRQVVGTSAFQSPQHVQTKVFDKLRVRVELEEIPHPSGRVLVTHIPSRPAGTAYNLDGAYLMRSGDQLVPMSEDRLRTVFSEGKPDWLSEIAVSALSAQEVVTLLDTQSYFDLMKRPLPASREAVLDRLVRERLLIEGDNCWSISKLGAILLAKRLDDFESLRRKASRVVVYNGRNKLSTRLDRFDTKGYAVGFESLIEFIDAQIPANEIIGAALRTEVKMFPREAIRELIANALVHQDFTQTGASVTIEIYDDRVEVSNPGQPFIAPERFIDEYQSRNEKLADIMRRMGICEEKGSGIDRVVTSAEGFQLPAPDFRTASNRTIAILFAHQEFEKMNSDARTRACYQHCCLKYVTNERMTNQSLRRRFDLPDNKAETVSRIIGDTVEKGLVKLEDPSNSSKRYAKYVPFWA